MYNVEIKGEPITSMTRSIEECTKTDLNPIVFTNEARAMDHVVEIMDLSDALSLGLGPNDVVAVPAKN